MTKEYILNFLKENHTLLEHKYSVDSIGLFGSYAKDSANEKSDIDFYVVFRQKTLDNMTGLLLYLEKVFDKKIDMLSYHSRLRRGLKQQIEKEVLYG
ncbi:MAG: hypothetical protein DSZ12_04190 [Sulfurovum sp.]|nr:MAG: hypothetical protein DSZ12_04190 [Sulfurovum sp.]